MKDIDIKVNEDQCIGCGLCVTDCTRGAITLEGGIRTDSSNSDCISSGSSTLGDSGISSGISSGSGASASGRERTCAKVNPQLCNECGHCVAVCPRAAVTLYGQGADGWTGCGAKDQDAGKDENVVPAPESFLRYLKMRRSVRHYKERDVEPEKLEMLIEAGRYSPTASNRQQNRFVILKENVEQVRKAAIEALHEAALDPQRDWGQNEAYRQSWTRMYNEYIAGQRDRLFFSAPVVVLIIGDEENRYAEIDGGIAASRMEAEANALGLGVCYIGFLNTAIGLDESIKEMLGIWDGEKLTVAFVTGYPDVKYQRPAPRKPANVTYL